MKPQSNPTESSLEPFPQFRERQAGLCGRTKIDFCPNENQKVSGARQYTVSAHTALGGREGGFYTKQDGKDSKSNLKIGLLVEVQMNPERKHGFFVNASPAEFVVMLQSPCPGEVSLEIGLNAI